VTGPLDWPSVWRPAVSIALALLPIAITQATLSPRGVVNGLLFGLILFLCAAAGFGAARLAPDRPLPHGAAAGALAYGLVQAVGVVLRVARGEDLAPVAYLYLALLCATCGMLGAMLGRRMMAVDDAMRRRREGRDNA
jgi:putative membrane protein (TIGR04086 family)